jgi:hypothetical protein
MQEALNERLVIAYERIAIALEGLRDEAKKAGGRYWPPQQPQKEAILTRMETDKERELKNQGARLRTVAEVIDPNAKEEELEDEYIGARTRQWMKEHPPEKSKQISEPLEEE